MMGGLKLSLAWTNLLAVSRMASREQGTGTKAVQVDEAAPEDHNSINVHHGHRAERWGGGSGPHAEQVRPLQN